MLSRYFTTGMRSLLLCLIAVLTLMAVPVGAAPRAAVSPPYPDAEWAGWGLAASFDSGAPVIKFAAYVGKNGSPPVVLGQIVRNITDRCTVLDENLSPATLSIDAAGYAKFDGNVFIECETPDWRAMIAELAPHLRPAKADACECPPTRSPFWASGEFIIHPLAPGESRLNPLVDASELGLTFSLPTTGNVARSRMTRSSGAYDSDTWIYDSVAGERVLVGQNGPIDVAIIDSFGGLPYLTDAGWRPFLINDVRGNRFGQWREPANSGTFTTLPQLSYTLTTRGGTVYIGRHAGTGELLQGRVRHIRTDPGCFGG